MDDSKDFTLSEINQEKLIKVLTIGNSGAGKTALIGKYVNDAFPVKFESTLGMDFQMKSLARKDGAVKVQIWVSWGKHFTKNMFTPLAVSFAFYCVTSVWKCCNFLFIYSFFFSNFKLENVVCAQNLAVLAFISGFNKNIMTSLIKKYLLLKNWD